MIISRTPFRMSFFGGGTDYPQWYRENGGRVLATTFNKYCYITCRYLPPFFEHASRIIYSKMEHVHTVDEIMHPSVRECLKFMNVEKGVEIHHDGDLPARTGLGSSSAFTVGLLHTLYALKGEMPTKQLLAESAIHLEQNMMKENVGSQDQVLAAHGGFNVVEFGVDGAIQLSPVTISSERCAALQNHMMLFFTGFARTASEIAEDQIKRVKKNAALLKEMHDRVQEAVTVLAGTHDIADFGTLLHENWHSKKALSEKISTSYIDDAYEAARSAGALGGKVLGAGGGGFLFIFARPRDHGAIREKLNNLLHVPFAFESAGSQIIFYEHGNGTHEK